MQFSSPSSSLESLTSFIKNGSFQAWLSVILSLMGLMLAGYGVYLLSTLASPEVEEALAMTDSVPSEVVEVEGEATEEVPKSGITLEIAGAVEKPGLVTVPTGSRLGEAIELAGGFSPQADSKFINQQLNLAELVKDASKTYIPFKGEMPLESASADPVSVVSSLSSDLLPDSSESSLISINTATEAQLDALEGIGPARAAAIIENRPYASLDELLSKKVLSATLFESLKNQLGI